MNKQHSKVTIGNGKIKMKGDFTGILFLKKSNNLDGFELDGVKNAVVVGTGHFDPPRFRDKVRTMITIWKWL